MGEIKKKLNINRITVKNLFLVILLMAIMAVIGAAARLIGGRAADINITQAQSCWVPPSGVGCSGVPDGSGEGCGHASTGAGVGTGDDSGCSGEGSGY